MAKSGPLSRQATLAFLTPATFLMLLMFALPIGLVVHQSVQGGSPLQPYSALLSDRLFLTVMRTTLEISLIACAASLLLGYPLAMHLAKQPPRLLPFYMSLILLPFWTSILVKSFAFTVVLGHTGLINQLLQNVLGLPGVKLLYNRTGVIIGMVHFLLPFMVFPIFNSLKAQNKDLRTAAAIMGSGPFRIFFKITLPLSISGIVAGTIMTLVLSMGMLVTPALLGGRQDIMIANLIDFYTRQTLNWSAAAAISVTLLVVSLALILLLSGFSKTERLVK